MFFEPRCSRFILPILSYFSGVCTVIELENKRAFPMHNFIYNSIIVTNVAKIAWLFVPTIENTFIIKHLLCERVPDFSLIDLKWRPDVPFNHQVSSVFFWISLSPANPILSQREREGDIDMDMDRQCHIMYSMHVDRYWPPTGPSTSLGGGWLLSTLRATILSLLSCTYCSVRTHLYQYYRL